MAEHEVNLNRLEAAAKVAAILTAIKCTQEPSFALEFYERAENWSKEDGGGELLIHPREETIEEARRCGKLNAALAWMDSNNIGYSMYR